MLLWRKNLCFHQSLCFPPYTEIFLYNNPINPLKYKKSVVVGFIHRIYRACSSWSHFHDSITEAKDVLINNQYPLDFVESLINSTLKSILVCSDDTINTSCHSESSESCDNNISLDSNACFNQFEEKDKFKFFINYRGKLTEKLAVSFKKLNAPCRLIMTMKKTKFILPSLKPFVPDMLRNNVVYKIQCPRCQSSYVGQTTRHLQQRFKEHIGNKGPVKTHFENCAITPTHDVISILGSMDRGEGRLLTLEALFTSFDLFVLLFLYFYTFYFRLLPFTSSGELHYWIMFPDDDTGCRNILDYSNIL